jgi:hypothetical protein
LIPKYPASIAIKLQLCLIMRPIILLTNVKAKIFAKNPTFAAGKIWSAGRGKVIVTK